MSLHRLRSDGTSCLHDCANENLCSRTGTDLLVKSKHPDASRCLFHNSGWSCVRSTGVRVVTAIAGIINDSVTDE
jgi:hypothetical protein